MFRPEIRSLCQSIQKSNKNNKHSSITLDACRQGFCSTDIYFSNYNYARAKLRLLNVSIWRIIKTSLEIINFHLNECVPRVYFLISINFRRKLWATPISRLTKEFKYFRCSFWQLTKHTLNPFSFKLGAELLTLFIFQTKLISFLFKP